MAAGMDGDTPASIVEKGTTSAQRRVDGTVATLPELAKEHHITSPAISIVGKVCALAERFEPQGLCLVPALACDRRGYRLGYGAGYYDRFLSNYPGHRVGVVYDRNLVPRLWNGRYDVPLELVVTDRRLHLCGGRSGQ